MKLFYPVVFTKEDVGFSTTVPDLEGCFSEGDTFEEAYQNTKKAIGLYLDGMINYPKASDPLSVKTKSDNQIMCIVDFDELEYKKESRTKAIKKTLTVPEWLNDEAEAAHINFSGVLQEALKERLNLN